MKSFRLLLTLPVVPLAMLAAPAALATNNLPPVGPFPDVVYLRQNCGTTQNCATTMSEMLTWTYNTRQPSAASPLLIDVGIGAFGGFTCSGPGANSSGFITLRGSGRHNTVLGASEVFGCQQLVFHDLSIVNITGIAFTWWYGGGATFSNVELTGADYAWWDITYSGPSQHYWWNSVLNAKPISSGGGFGTAVFQTYGATHRFYGGEINSYAIGDGTAAVHVNSAAGKPGEIQMYGSAIRARANPGASVSNLIGVQVDLGQTFHLHGGSIGVNGADSASADVSVTAIKGAHDSQSGSVSTGHVLESAFALKPKGTGTATRVTGVPAGKGLEAPFLWSNGPNSPPVNSSQKGADMYVETDCSSSKCSSAATADGSETHLMIFNGTCTTDGPWFDVVTGRCRGL